MFIVLLIAMLTLILIAYRAKKNYLREIQESKYMEEMMEKLNIPTVKRKYIRDLNKRRIKVHIRKELNSN